MAKRDARFVGIIGEEIRRDARCLLIGAGSVGSHVAYALVKLGITVGVYDPDMVEPENCGVQIYGDLFLGMSKIAALMSTTQVLSGGTYTCLLGATELVTPTTQLGEALFDTNEKAREMNGIDCVISTIDSMHGRADLAVAVHTAALKGTALSKNAIFIDVRVGGEGLRHHIFRDLHAEDFVDRVTSTLTTDEEAQQDPCGATMFLPTALMASALVVNSVKAHLRGEKPPEFMGMDLRHWMAFGMDGQEGTRAV